MESTQYTCPMHPEVTSDGEGRCSKCGMNLVPSAMPADTGGHAAHSMKLSSMWMTMGMDHAGLAGREMAALMEIDIRNKFWFAFILTIPIIAYSPLGEKILGLQLPAPIPSAWILFILTTPVFFYSGWIFLYSTYKALQQKIVNMAVLIAVGITAAYAFSIALTVLGSSDSYYEAAAMLITFVLFGHWMEMKSRRGTTDALQALMNLVPPQARIMRNGKEILIATVLMKSDPLDILRAIPVAAGVLYPQFGISLRPEIAALLMSISSIIVATNAVLLKRVEKSLIIV